MPTALPTSAATHGGSPTAPRRRSRGPLAVFSELECQVLRLESAGLPVAEIAVRLGVTERSVRDARHRARSRLGGEPLADLVSLLVS